MAVERERRFLIKDPVSAILACALAEKRLIVQWYLSTKPAIRIRCVSGEYILTSKRRINRDSSEEVEIPIDPINAQKLIVNAVGFVAKTRLRCGPWEIDIFHEENHGLIIAEIELEEGEEIDHLPEWIGREITGVRKYANSQLAIKPFRGWKK